MQYRNGKRAAIYGLASAAWIGVLFFFSGQTGQASGALSEKLTRWLFGRWIEQGADAVLLEHLLRKAAHVGVFAVEGFLLGLALMHCLRRRTAFLIGTLGCGALAVANELHQRLSDGRTCSVGDVFIDTAGAVLGLILAAAVLHAFSSRRFRKKINSCTTGDGI